MLALGHMIAPKGAHVRQGKKIITLGFRANNYLIILYILDKQINKNRVEKKSNLPYNQPLIEKKP